jgi:pyruvate kinase
MIRKLVAKGVNVFRFNLFHGDQETVRQWIHWIREAVPFVIEEDRHLLLHIDQMIVMLKNKRLVKEVDRVVVTTGVPVGIPNWTNVICMELAP